MGEDGSERIVLDGPRIELQQFLLNQRSQGRLLAIASQNNEEDAWEAFRRPEMLRQPEHFAAHRINWEPKSFNLADLSRELSLGLESFILIDDSAKDIAEVESNQPQGANSAFAGAARRDRGGASAFLAIRPGQGHKGRPAAH